MWKTKFSSHQGYLFGLLFSRNAKVYYKLFYSVWKEMSHKPLKVAAAKKYFSSLYPTCFDECFLFHAITGRHYFYTNLSLPRGLVQKLSSNMFVFKCLWRVSFFRYKWEQKLRVPDTCYTNNDRAKVIKFMKLSSNSTQCKKRRNANN